MHRLKAAILAGLLFAALTGLAASAPAALTGAVKTTVILDQATLTGLAAVTIETAFETSGGRETGTYTGVLLWELVGKAELVNDPGNAMKEAVIVVAVYETPGEHIRVVPVCPASMTRMLQGVPVPTPKFAHLGRADPGIAGIRFCERDVPGGGRNAVRYSHAPQASTCPRHRSLS